MYVLISFIKLTGPKLDLFPACAPCISFQTLDSKHSQTGPKGYGFCPEFIFNNIFVAF